MTQDTVDELNKQNPSPFHTDILAHAMALVKMSRSKMSQNYSSWDLQDQVYRGERWMDEDDIKQAKREKPIKMVVPNTFAQCMTFASFLFLMFNQRSPQPFYSLLPSGNEDYGDKEQDCENIIERDLRHNNWNILLFQHLLDVSRFGPAILECSWTRKLSRIYQPSEPAVSTYNNASVEVRGGSEWREYVKYEGNLVRAISPYRFFPDTRFPLVDFQKGEFCASEEEYSKSFLRELAAAGEVAGIDHIQGLPANLDQARGGPTRTAMGIVSDRTNSWLAGPSKSEGTVVVTKMQVWLVPSKYTFGNDKKLGPEEFPVLYHLWYANDNRVIRCEPAYWWHNEFGYSVSQFTPDMHHTVTLGLADLIYRLQDVISWHINARITDVRRNMRGRLIIDPTAVDTTDLNDDGDVYLRKGMGKGGIDRFIKQLDQRDITGGHMVDADLLSKIMEVVTGVNGNAMGQYNSGRRSAQEARVVTAGAAGRMKMHGHLIWAGGIGPMGKQMLSNSRQSLSQEMFMRALGRPDQADQAAVQAAATRYSVFKGTPEEIVTGDDYFTFDATLASEKGFTAQSLQELLVAIISSNPLAAEKLTSAIDPAKLMKEIQYLRGSGNINRFKYSSQEQQEIQLEQQQRYQMEHQPPPPKPPSMSLTGKMSQSQEDAAAELAGIPGKRGEKPQANPASNGATKK